MASDDNVIFPLRAVANEAFGLFPEVDCLTCRRPRLAFGELEQDELVYVCAYCGARGVLHGHIDAAQLELSGLTIAAPPTLEPPLPKKKGCSKSCKKSRAPKSADTGAQASGGCTNCSSCSSGGCG